MGRDDPPQDERRTEPLRHRPVVPVLIGLACGIALDAALRPDAWVWFVLGCAAVLLSLWGVRRGLRAWGHWVLALALLVPFGGMCHDMRFRTKPRWHLQNLPVHEGAYYYLRGEVVREPLWRYRQHAFAPGDEWSDGFWLTQAELEALSGDGSRWQRAAGGIAVFVSETRPDLNVGDRIEFFAPLSKNRPPTNPGERDSAFRYGRSGSYGTASVSSADAIKVIERARWYSSVPAAVSRLRTITMERLERRLRSAEAGSASRRGLIEALLFGDRGALPEHQSDLLRESGTLHFLAISGLHVGIFCMFVASLLTWLGVRAGLRSVLMIALIWAYVLFTGFHVSAVRAGWMLTFMLAAPLVQRQRDSLSALAGSAFLILLVWPQQLFMAGFQLTFVAVWAIVCIYPQLHGILWPWEDWLARVQQPGERTLAADLWRWGRSYLLLSCVVWAATAPIQAYHFNLLCLVAPLLNLIMWLLVLLLLLTCFALAVALLLGGLGAGLLVPLALYFSGCIEHVLELVRGLPGFGLYMPSPPSWWVGLFYVALAIWVLRDRLPHGRRAFVAAAVVLAASYLAHDVALRADRRFRLTVADVGSGQAVLLQLPDGQELLFDAGSVRSGAARALTEMLWAAHVGRLDAVVISHLDGDHCDFVPHLARRFDIARIVLPRAGELKPASACVREGLEAQELPVRLLSEHDRIEAGGLRCEVLHPDARFVLAPDLSQNEKSLVLLCRFRGLSFLLTGDIQGRAMERLCRQYGDELRADILMMPHHGHYDPALGDFVSLVRPALAIASGGESDCDPATRDLLCYKQGVPLWITGQEGAIIVTFDGAKARVLGYRSGRAMEFSPSGSPALSAAP